MRRGRSVHCGGRARLRRCWAGDRWAGTGTPLFSAETGEIPVVDTAAADPDGIAFHADAIAARGGDAEAAPAKAARIGEDAGDAADGFALFGFRAGDGAAARADVRLSVRIEDGKVQPVRAGVALARPEIAKRGLLARVDAGDGCGLLDKFRGHGFAHRIIGGTHVARELDMGDVERGADFVVAAGLAVLRQFGFDLHPGDVEQVADGVLIFVGVEAAQSGAAALGDDACSYPVSAPLRPLTNWVSDSAGGRGMRRRRHLTCGDAVVNLDPGGEVIGVGGFVVEFGEVEPCAAGAEELWQAAQFF